MANSQSSSQIRPTAPRFPALPPRPIRKRPRSEFEMIPGVQDMPVHYNDMGNASHAAGFLYAYQEDMSRHQVSPPFNYYSHNGSSSYSTYRARGTGTEILLPHDASNKLFVQGFPIECAQREAAHIFRPFLGYRGLRLIKRNSRLPRGGQVTLCFVEFDSPAQAAMAMDCLQGYKFDRDDLSSSHLKLQFSRQATRSRDGDYC